jgi:O-antigen/teichoic acid export membrane protein
MGNVSRQSAIHLAGTLFTIMAGYAFKIYVSRELGAANLGLYALGTNTQSFLQIFVSLGLPLTAARFVAVYAGQRDIARQRALVWGGLALIGVAGCLMALVMLAARRWIANGIYQEPELAAYLPVFAGLLPLLGMVSFLGQVLRGYQEVARSTVISSFVLFTARIALSVSLLAAGWQLWGYIAGDVISAVLGTVLLGWVVWTVLPAQARRPSLKFVWDRQMVTMMLTMFAVSLLGFFSGQADRLALGIYLDAEQVGIYSVALTTAAYIPMLLTSVNSIFGPTIADLYARGQMQLLEQMFQTLTKWVTAVTIPLVVTIIVFARPFMMIFGPEFTAGWPALVALALGQLVNVGTGSVGYLLLMSGRQRYELAISALNVAIVLGLFVVLIPRWGVLGAALALSVGVVGSNLMRMILAWHTLRIRLYNRGFLKLVVPAAASTALVAGLRLAYGGTQALGIGLLWICGSIGVAYIVFAAVAYVSALDSNDRVLLDAVMTSVKQFVKRMRDKQNERA